MPCKPTRLPLVLLVPAVLLAEAAVVVPLFMALGRPPEDHGTMDSVALYVARDPAQSLVFVTDKDDGFLEVHSPVTGKFLRKIGGAGSGPGQLNYPNGVAVAYDVPTGSGTKDVLFAVERDNHRVSMFALPQGEFLGHFGSSELSEPYGVALYWKGQQLQAWITATGTSPDRVYVYRIAPGGEGLKGTMSFHFEAAGYLESIVIDPVAQRALLCDEGDGQDIMVYDLQGKLVQRFGQGLFVDEPEGLVIYDLGNGNGYIIVADQNAEPVEFEVFNRKSYKSLGHFTGTTRGTDGVALTQAALPNLPSGSFYAVHSDDIVHIYDWSQIAQALGLSTRILGPRTAVGEQPVALPSRYALLASHPNPWLRHSATAAMNIRYQVDYLARVRLEIYNLSGQRVAGLVEAVQPAGEYQVRWQGRTAAGEAVAAGTYFARLTVGNDIHVQKLMVAH